jgi:hypothetical protein
MKWPAATDAPVRCRVQRDGSVGQINTLPKKLVHGV